MPTGPQPPLGTSRWDSGGVWQESPHGVGILMGGGALPQLLAPRLLWVQSIDSFCFLGRDRFIHSGEISSAFRATRHSVVMRRARSCSFLAALHNRPENLEAGTVSKARHTFPHQSVPHVCKFVFAHKPLHFNILLPGFAFGGF